MADAVPVSTIDIEFHDAVCDAADNFLLAQFMRIINTLGKVSRDEQARRVRPGAALADHEAHRGRASRRRSRCRRTAMTADLDDVEEALVRQPDQQRAQRTGDWNH